MPGRSSLHRITPSPCTTPHIPGGAIHIYRFGPGGRALELVHTTPLDDIPRAMVAFRGRLLAGVGASVRLYDLGECEN